MHNVKDSPPGLFIGGTGRSGTNILKKRLSTHPQVAALPFEPRFSVDPDGVLPTFRALSAGASPFEMNVLLRRMEQLLSRLSKKSVSDSLSIYIEQFLKTFINTEMNLRAYKEWELEKYFSNFEEVVVELLDSLTSNDYMGIWPARVGLRNRINNRISLSAYDPELTKAFQRFYTKLYTVFLESKNAKTIIDDNTYNLMYASELTLLMPNAHLVHVVRDPRDVVASFLQQRWSPNEVEAAIVFYKVTMDNILKMLDSIEPEKVSVIRLEDLCQDPEKYIRQLEKKVNLEKGKPFTTNDFLGSNQGRWKKEVLNKNHNLLNQQLQPYISRFDYE